MNWTMRWLLMALFCFWAQTSALSQTAGPDEAQAMVLRGLAHIESVGLSAALKDFSAKNGQWAKGELYLFVIDYRGVFLAHGSNRGFIGKNMLDLQDANGKYLVREFIKAARSGKESWVNYLWTNPLSKKIEAKNSYVRAIPGKECLIAAGYYRIN